MEQASGENWPCERIACAPRVNNSGIPHWVHVHNVHVYVLYLYKVNVKSHVHVATRIYCPHSFQGLGVFLCRFFILLSVDVIATCGTCIMLQWRKYADMTYIDRCPLPSPFTEWKVWSQAWLALYPGPLYPEGREPDIHCACTKVVTGNCFSLHILIGTRKLLLCSLSLKVRLMAYM